MNASDRPVRSAALEAEAQPLRGLPESERSLLIVDDDAPLCQRLARAMERRGFVVATAESVAAGVSAATAHPPAFAVVDLRLGDGSGLEVVTALRSARHRDVFQQTGRQSGGQRTGGGLWIGAA